MTKKILALLLLSVAFLPLKTTEALSLAYLVTEQHLTIKMAEDGSAKIEDRLHYSGPENFELTYTIYQPSSMIEEVASKTSNAFNIDNLNLEIEVINLETGDRQLIEASDQREANRYHAYPEEENLMIDLQMVDYGTEYGLVFHYDFENFVTNYEDVAVIETLKANGGPLQDYTSSTVRLILPGGLDFSVDQTEDSAKQEAEEAASSETSKVSESSGVESTNSTEEAATSGSNQAQISLPFFPKAQKPTDEIAHFSERLPGDLWAWLFYAEKSQLTIEPGDDQTIMQIHFPRIGLSEPTELQIATPINRFPDNPHLVTETILDELMEMNRERMETAEPYEDLW